MGSRLDCCNNVVVLWGGFQQLVLALMYFAVLLIQLDLVFCCTLLFSFSLNY